MQSAGSHERFIVRGWTPQHIYPIDLHSFNGNINVFKPVTNNRYFTLLTESPTQLKASMKRGFCACIIADLENPKRAKQRFCQY